MALTPDPRSSFRLTIDFEVILVSNPFSRTTTGPTLYNVRMDSAHTSKRIREIFSGFFRRIRPVQMPPALKGIEVRNKVTLETKIRITILRRLGERYRDTNPGSSYIVRGFDSRPTIFITPPKTSTEQARKYNFIQAATTLPATFTDEDLAVIFQTVGDRFRGKLQSIFLVLNDDDHDRCLELAKNHNRGPRRGGPAQPSGSGPGPGSGLGTSSSTSFGHVHGRGHGVDAQDSRPAHVSGSGSGGDLDPKFLSSLISPPPPPAEIETENSRAHDDRPVLMMIVSGAAANKSVSSHHLPIGATMNRSISHHPLLIGVAGSTAIRLRRPRASGSRRSPVEASVHVGLAVLTHQLHPVQPEVPAPAAPGPRRARSTSTRSLNDFSRFNSILQLSFCSALLCLC